MADLVLLALDQSSRVTGYAIFEDENLIDCGKFELQEDNFGKRLFHFKKQIINLIDKYNIDEVVFEDIYQDDNKINNCLGEIDKTLKNYPNGFFKEMKDYGMPLTIYLVNSISGNISELTDAKDKNETPIYNKALLAEDTTLYAVWEKVENKKTSSKIENSKTNTNTNNNNSSTNTNKPNQNANNNTNINNNENTALPEEKPSVVEKTQAEKNDEYRKQPQNKYSVKIAY